MSDVTLSPPVTRAGTRLGLGLLGALVIALVAVPLAVLVRSEYAPLVTGDLEVSRAAEEATGRSVLLLRAAQVLTLLGDPALLTLGAALLALVLWRRGSGRLALFVLVSRGGALVLSQGLKQLVDRARPVFDVPVATALGPSFPSGHALAAAAFWTTLAVLLQPYVRRDRLLLAVAVGVAVVVAATRVLLGVHYPSDVAGGVLLGLGWTAVCTAVFVAERRERGVPVRVQEEGIGT